MDSATCVTIFIYHFNMSTGDIISKTLLFSHELEINTQLYQFSTKLQPKYFKI